MNYLEEFENKKKTFSELDPSKSPEEIAVEVLETFDFHNPEVVKQFKYYVLNNIEVKGIQQNNPLTKEQLASAVYILTKSSLSEKNLDNVKVVIRSKDEQEKASNFAAQYSTSPDGKEIVIFNEYIFQDSFMAKSTHTSQYILRGFAQIVKTIEHEIRHAEQYRDMEELQSRPLELTPELYSMQKENLARNLLVNNGELYDKNVQQHVDKTKNFPLHFYYNRLYLDNHDDYHAELDADYYGYTRGMQVLKEVCPTAYNDFIQPYMVTHPMNARFKEVEKKLANLQEVTWTHDTNANSGYVQANYKSSLIIDAILPKLPKATRDAWLKSFPVLSLSYTPDGQKKSLEQVEKERQEKIDEVLANGSDEQVQEQATTISKLYDSIIEGDAMLSLEYQLRHIARTSYVTDRYFTDNGQEVRYSAKHVRQEMEEAMKKILAIAPVIESVDARTVNEIVNKYAKEASSTKFNQHPESFRFRNDKIKNFQIIKQEIEKNNEIFNTILNDKNEVKKKYIQKQVNEDKAIALLQKVFPDFEPEQKVYVLSLNEYRFMSAEMKQRLEDSYYQYRRDARKLQDDRGVVRDPNYINPAFIKAAIDLLYPIDPTNQQITDYIDKLKTGEIKLFKNIFSEPEVEVEAEEEDTSDNSVHNLELKPSNNENNQEEIAPKKETQKKAKKTLTEEQQTAVDLIKKVLPEYEPEEITAQEKLIVQRSIDKYNLDLISKIDLLEQNEIDLDAVYNAVDVLYPIEITAEDEIEYDRNVIEGKTKILSHCAEEQLKTLNDEEKNRKDTQNEEEHCHNHDDRGLEY